MNQCKDCGWCSKKVYIPPIGQRIKFLYCTLNDFKTDTGECTRWISKEERKELEELRDEIAKDWGIERHKELLEQQEWENRREISMIEDEMTYEERDQLAEAREAVDKDFEEEANWDPNKEDR